MPSPSLRASTAEARRRGLPPISTEPSSGATKPLAIPSRVDFPDPFSPTSAWISPARASTLTSRSACTAPNAFETRCSDSTTGLTGPGLDIRSPPVCGLSLLRIHAVEQAQRDERRRRGLHRVALDARVPDRLILELDREHDRGRDLR